MSRETETPGRAGAGGRYPGPYTCPVRLTLDVVGGKWKSHILWELRGSARGFNALLTAVTGISHKVLTQQLRQLERDGLVERRVRATRARRIDYGLTPFGRTLRPSLDALARWAKAHHANIGAPLDWPDPAAAGDAGGADAGAGRGTSGTVRRALDAG